MWPCGIISQCWPETEALTCCNSDWQQVEAAERTRRCTTISHVILFLTSLFMFLLLLQVFHSLEKHGTWIHHRTDNKTENILYKFDSSLCQKKNLYLFIFSFFFLICGSLCQGQRIQIWGTVGICLYAFFHRVFVFYIPLLHLDMSAVKPRGKSKVFFLVNSIFVWQKCHCVQTVVVFQTWGSVTEGFYR